MKTLALVCALTLMLGSGVMLYIRLAPSDPARWHVDPCAVPDPETPNFARLSTQTALPPMDARARLAEQARAEGATILAQDDTLTTWIARSRLMGYPDYVTIRLDETQGGTRVTALSRARFGRGDMGVNAARLQRWIGALTP